MRSSYLVELAVTTIEDELERDVGTVLNAADVGGSKVDIDAERALAGGLEERKELLEVAGGVTELGEVGRILDRGNNTTDCSWNVSMGGCLIRSSMHSRVHFGCSELSEMKPLEVGNVVRFETALL